MRKAKIRHAAPYHLDIYVTGCGWVPCPLHFPTPHAALLYAVRNVPTGVTWVMRSGTNWLYLNDCDFNS